MTVPDCAWPVGTNARADAARTLRIRLEHFLTPNHLALIVARDCGLAAARGLALVLEEPREHDYGFANLEHGRCDLILTSRYTSSSRWRVPASCSAACSKPSGRPRGIQDLAHRYGPGLARRPRQGARPPDRRR